MISIVNKQPPTAKNVQLYKNGDSHYRGRRLVIQRQVNNLDHFFKIATESLNPSFGAVRNLYTPEGGTKIKSFEEIQSGRSYVVAGNENFKHLSRGAKYEEIGWRKPQPVKKTYSHIKPVFHNHRLIETSGRYKQAVKEINQPVQLWLHVNADNQSNPVRMLLPSRILKLKWDMILDYFTDKVGIRLGRAVRKLVTVDGDVIPSAKSLVTGRTYVACGSERFRKLDYKIGGNTNTSHLHVLKRKPLPPIGIKRRETPENNPQKSARSDKDKEDNSFYLGMVDKMQKSKNNKSKKGATPRAETDDEGGEVFKGKAVQVKKKQGKAKKDNKNNDYVEEDPNMKTVVPVEMQKAKQVGKGKKKKK